jgi:hypothetical protein
MMRGPVEPSVGSATSSLMTSAGWPLSECRSRTPIQSAPSGVTRPSAKRSRRPSTSGVIGTGSLSGSMRYSRWSSKLEQKTTPSWTQ